MTKWIRKYGYAFYLGSAVALFTGYGLATWQWWAINVPTLILISFARYED